MKYYFLGICGIAMGNVALLLRSLGHEVCGADSNIYPPMSDVLLESGIKLYEGYNPDRLRSINPDYIVIGNAMTRGNVEVEYLLESRAHPYYSLPELLHKDILAKRFNIVVTGTHGKTTTTTLIAYFLNSLGEDPGYLIGGVPKSLPSGAYVGSGPFVIEGDEYDSAFFDKRSKFIHYLPSILIVNNIEFDHGDIFRDLKDIQRSFSHLLRVVPRNGFILINGDDINIKELMPIDWSTVYRVGEGGGNDLIISDFREDEKGSEFSLFWKGAFWTRVRWGLCGMYNARNAAMAALAAGLAVNRLNPMGISLEALGLFEGVKRRQEVLYQDDKIVVVEDFGHHPTAVRETLVSLRNRYPDRRITACFEPRSNTACRRFHQEGFREALGFADIALLGAVYRADLYLERDRLDTERIAREVGGVAFSSNEGLLEYLKGHVETGVVCFFSNGSFDGIMQAFVKMCNTTLQSKLK